LTKVNVPLVFQLRSRFPRAQDRPSRPR